MGKRAALISGLLAVAVIIAGVLSWRELRELDRMRHNPDHLLRVIDSPQGTISGQAVRRIFASGDFPGSALLRGYIEGLNRGLFDFKGIMEDGDVLFWVEPSDHFVYS